MPVPAPAVDPLLALFNHKDRSKLNLTTVTRKVQVSTSNNRQVAQTKVVTKTVSPQIVSRKPSSPSLRRIDHQPSKSVSRKSSAEPKKNVSIKSSKPKRLSPIITTPQFSDSSSSEDESETRRKRVKISRQICIDPNRKMRDVQAFSGQKDEGLKLIHAVEIANSEKQEYEKFKYTAHFTVLKDTEDESPNILLSYPSGYQSERYQLVQPTDKTDFKPMDEIIENMKIVAEFYMDDATATRITCPEDGSGIVERLERYARDGARKGRVGAQSNYMKVIEEYNDLMVSKLKDGTIVRCLDDMVSLPPKLVKYIVKDQIYSRAVSPDIKLLTQYEGWSDNVYGELLPKFLHQIFQETKLTSEKVFVDLGSGVGNCVIQAALEAGCEAWGCEMMGNCTRLAEAQALELPARCKLWGIEPGGVNLIQGNFLDNAEIGKTLKRADVVLINNQAFTPETNDLLKNIFLDLKEGCQIVSLKPFRHPTHKIKETNVNDPINVLKVVEKQRYSDMVSWADKDGVWYIQTVDRTELKAFIKSM